MELHPPRRVHSWEQQKQRQAQEAGKTWGHAPLGYFRLRATRQVPAWFHFLFYEMNKYAFLVSNIITLAQHTSNLPIGELFGSPEAEQDLGSLSQLWELGRITHPLFRHPQDPPWVPSSSRHRDPVLAPHWAHLQHCPCLPAEELL